MYTAFFWSFCKKSWSVGRPTDPLNSSVGSILWERSVWIYNLTVTIVFQKYWELSLQVDVLINTLLLYIPLFALTDGQTEWLTEERIQNKPFGIPYGRMNHLCHHWNKHMLTIVQNTFYNRRARWLSLVDERFVINKLVAVSIIFFDLVWQTMLPNLIASFQQGTMVIWIRVVPPVSWLLFKSMKHYFQGSSNRVKNANRGNQRNPALKEAAIMSKMRTPAITLWFPEHRFKEIFYLGFFIKEKRLASQVVFLVKSKHWVLAKIRFFMCFFFF